MAAMSIELAVNLCISWGWWQIVAVRAIACTGPAVRLCGGGRLLSDRCPSHPAFRRKETTLHLSRSSDFFTARNNRSHRGQTADRRDYWAIKPEREAARGSSISRPCLPLSSLRTLPSKSQHSLKTINLLASFGIQPPGPVQTAIVVSTFRSAGTGRHPLRFCLGRAT
jgi:hypothetical protein